MTREEFFGKFEVFANAPGAVAKMRELVLELAVRGRLVEQVAEDGDGQLLLDQIREKNGSPAIEAAASDLLPDDLPESWALATLGEVAALVRGVSFPGGAKSKMRSGEHVVCLRTASVQAEVVWDDLLFIPPTYVTSADQWVRPCDILISMANSYALVGKVAIVRRVPERTTFGAFLAVIRAILIDPFFLLCVLRSRRMQAGFRSSSSQTTNIANISLGRMRPLPVPLPPLAEQKRIVAKVDELMALCDRLEAQENERETCCAALARASIARFGEAPTPENLEVVFRNSYSITPTDLRRSILSLAVRGKLVPQDPNVEPAVEIVRRISAIRQQLPNGKRVKELKSVRSVEAAKLDLIPRTWTWCRLGDLVLDFRYGTSRPCGRRRVGVPVLRIPNIKDGRIDAGDLKYTEMPMPEFEQLRLREGDLLLIRSNGSEGLVGRSAIVTSEHEGFAYAGYLVRARIPREALSVRYLHLALSTQAIRDQIEKPIRTTSGVKNINTTELSNLLLPLPPLAEQHRIAARVEELTKLVDSLESQTIRSHAMGAKLAEAMVAELTA